jgi:hypothetical protein
MKLRECKRSLGGFAHLYIKFSTCDRLKDGMKDLFDWRCYLKYRSYFEILKK